MKKIIFGVLFIASLVCGIGQNDFQKEIEQFDSLDTRNAPILRGQIMLYGSSTFRLWADAEKACAIADPKSPLKNLKVVNRGFGGSQAHHAIYYFWRVVVPHQPAYLFFYEGDNDLAAGKTVEQTFQDYRIFTNIVKKYLPKTHLIIVSVKPSPSRMALLEKQNHLNQMLQKHCAALKNVHYLDIVKPMLTAEGKPNPDLFKEDMLHLNDKGYALWRDAIQVLYRSIVVK